MQIKEILVSEIKIGDRYRTDLGEIGSLAEDIAKVGLLQPITVSPELLLLAGERRLRAFEKLKIKTISAIIRPIDGELDLREIELIENAARKDMTWLEQAQLEFRIHQLKRKTKAKWSQRDTARLLNKSQTRLNRHIILAAALDPIPELALCKTESEAWKLLMRVEEDLVLEELSRRIEKGMADEEADTETASTPGSGAKEKGAKGAKKAARTETAKASQWAAKHYIIGDALEGMAALNVGTCHFAEVDPPYAIELDKKRGRTVDTRSLEQYNEIPVKDYPEFLEQAARLVYRALGANAHCVWWFGPTWFNLTQSALQEAGFKVSDIPAIWYKGQRGQTNSPETHLANSYEMFWHCRKGNPALLKRGRSNVFEYPPVSSQDKIHPTERPIELMEEILATFAAPAARVLVPFLGSGVTLQACYKRRMIGFGWDLTEAARNRFLERIQVHGRVSRQPEAESGDGQNNREGGRRTRGAQATT